MSSSSPNIKLPHMPLWVYDIRTDEDCIVMSDQEFGRYMRLLIHQWVEGSVPADAAVASRACGLDPESVQAIRSLLDRKFTATDGKRRQNTRLAQERESAIQKVQRMRDLGKKGGKAKAVAHAKANAVPHARADALAGLSGSDSVSGSCVSSSEGSAEGGGAHAPPAPEYPPPLDTPEFRAKWAEWLSFRSESRWPSLKPRSVNTQLRKLAEHGHAAALWAIDHSIANAYRGLFPDKFGGAGQGGVGPAGDRQTPGAGTAAERAAARRGEIAGEEIDLPVLRFTDTG